MKAALLLATVATAGTATARTTSDEVLARAIVWMMEVAPDAKEYRVEVAGTPASEQVLARIAEISRTTVVAGGVRVLAPKSDSAEAVAIASEMPEWVGSDEAHVKTHYLANGRTVGPCEVQVRRSPELGGWLVRTPSDVACWRRPSEAR